MPIQFIMLAQEYAQEEYGLGMALAIGMVFLGLILICIPRFRKASIFEGEKKGKNKKSRSKGKKRR